MAMVRDPAWYERHRVPLTTDGTMPFARYVVRAKGSVEIGNLSCAMCHTRVMPDGTAVLGAQGNFPFDAVTAADASTARRRRRWRVVFGRLGGAPWDAAGDDALAGDDAGAVPAGAGGRAAGVIVRQGTSLFAPPAIPDLIGIRDRKYLDKTGLGRHRGIADVMRYAAMNQTLDVLGNYGGFVPGAADCATLPPPGKGLFSGSSDRYSDAQLYALAQFIYSHDAAAESESASTRARDAARRCSPRPAARAATRRRSTRPTSSCRPTGSRRRPITAKRYDILDARVGTDPALTMKTRRGTGYYKIPSLKGVWYRGPFEHSGSVATLEDWFDPRAASRRLRADRLQGLRRENARSEGPSVRPEPLGGRSRGADRVPEDAVAVIHDGIVDA